MKAISCSSRSLLHVGLGALFISVRYSLMIPLFEEILVLCEVITATPLLLICTLVNPRICVLGVSETSQIVHVLIVGSCIN